MKSKLDKRTVIGTLFLIAVAVLAANIIIIETEKDSNEIKNNNNNFEVSGKFIDSKVNTALSNFGIVEEWIKISRKMGDDSVFASYKVDIPEDLPMTLILGELIRLLPEKSVKIVSEEKKIGGKTELRFYSGNKLKLTAELDYNKEIKRNAGMIGFLISDFNNLNKEELDRLFEVNESFAVLLIPSKKNRDFADTVINYKKEFVVLLNDEITDLEYKLRPDLSLSRLKSVFRTILGHFNNAIFFLMDHNSEIYNSAVKTFLQNEFEKRSIKLIFQNELFPLNGEDAEQKVDLFRSIVKSTGKNDKELLLLSASDFFLIHPQIEKFRKLGYKFINPSIVVSENEEE